MKRIFTLLILIGFYLPSLSAPFDAKFKLIKSGTYGWAEPLCQSSSYFVTVVADPDHLPYPDPDLTRIDDIRFIYTVKDKTTFAVLLSDEKHFVGYEASLYTSYKYSFPSVALSGTAVASIEIRIHTPQFGWEILGDNADVMPPPDAPSVSLFNSTQGSFEILSPQDGLGYLWYGSTSSDLVLGYESTFYPPRSGQYYAMAHIKNNRSCLSLPGLITAPVTLPNVAFTQQKVIKQEGVIAVQQVDNLSKGEVDITTNYIANDGSIIQSNRKEHSPNGFDVIVPFQYNYKGLVEKEFLPFISSQKDGSYIANLIGEVSGGLTASAYMQQFTGQVPSNSKPYSETLVENAPYPTWEKRKSSGDDFLFETKTSVYRSAPENTGLTGLKYLLYNPLSEAFDVVGQPENEVRIERTETTGARYTYQILDINGLVLAQVKISNQGSDKQVTLYGYDQWGKKKIEISPKGFQYLLDESVQEISFTSRTRIADETLSQLATSYHFDTFERLTAINYPGGLSELYLFDRFNRVLLTQTFNDARNNFYAYSLQDIEGKTIETGKLKIAGDPGQLQIDLDQYTGSYVSKNENSGEACISGWINHLQNLSAFEKRVVTSRLYYDTYDLDGDYADDYRLNTSYSYQGCSVCTQFKQAPHLEGKSTINSVLVDLENDTWVNTVYFYDALGRLIQTQIYDGGFGYEKTIISRFLDFTGLVIGEQTSVYSGESDELIVSYLRNKKYDHAGRLLRSTLALAGKTYLEEECTYNENESLRTRKLPGAPVFNYKYDKQGRLIQINNPDLRRGNEIFAQKIFYHLEDNQIPVSVRNTGNPLGLISSVKWISPLSKITKSNGTDPLQGNKTFSYHFGYDGYDRLNAANFTTQVNINGHPTWLWNGNVPGTVAVPQQETFAMTHCDYDENGNLTHLNHHGLKDENAWGYIDSLELSYSGNVLKKVNEQATGGGGQRSTTDFNTLSNPREVDFTFDANGSLESSSEDGLPVYAYDEVTGLLTSVQYGGADVFSAKYNAAGQHFLSRNHKAVSEFHQAYKKEIRLFAGGGGQEWLIIPMSHGRMYQLNGGAWKNEYHAYDHLGSLRAAWRYYPTAEEQSQSQERGIDKVKYLDDVATMENSRVLEEDSLFQNLERTRVLDALRARTGMGLALVSANDQKPFGPMKIWEVKKGDSISVKAPVYWEQTSDPNQFINLLAYLASILSGSVTPVQNADGTPSLVLSPLLQIAVASAPTLLSTLNGEGKPKAFFRYVRFNKDSVIIFEKTIPITEASKEVWNELVVADEVTEDGYSLAYLVSEGGAPLYADDFRVEGYQTVLLAERHYYPYGLPWGTCQGIWGDWTNDRELIAPGLPGFTGQPEINPVWVHSFSNFGARYYDARLGRWHGPDPKFQFHSPYNYTGGNPVMGVDPNGEWAHILAGAILGGTFNVITHIGRIKSFKDAVVAFGIGAVAGGVGAATMGIGYAAAGGGGFLAGAAGAMTGTAYSSPIQGLGNQAYFGDPYDSKQYVKEIAYAGLTSGIATGVAAKIIGRSFWTGKRMPLPASVDNPTIVGVFNEGGKEILTNRPLNGNYAAKTGANFLKFGGDEAVVHFGKHADQIMKVTGKSAYNLKNYVDDANWIIQNGTYSSKLNGYYHYMGNAAKGESLFGFVGMKNGGSTISTFHIKTATQLGLK